MLTQFARIERRNVGERSRSVTVADAGQISGTTLQSPADGFVARLRFEATGSTPAVYVVHLRAADLLATLRAMLHHSEHMSTDWHQAQDALAVEVAAALDSYNAACLRDGK